MHAFFYARPLRRRPIVTAALISAGAHAAFLFGFVKDPPPPVVLAAVKEPEEKPTEIPEPPKVYELPRNALANSSASTNEPDLATRPNPSTHARLRELPSVLDPSRVTTDFRPDTGQKINPGSPTVGIPPSDYWGGRGPGPGLYEIKDLDKRPDPVAQVAPEYPFLAKSQGIEGVVVVRFIVTATGKVESAMVISSPHPLMSEAALKAVKLWTFRAGMKSGIKVATRMEIPLTFRLGQ